MQLNIDGHHVDVSDAMKDYVTKRMDKLERHFDHITNSHVTLTVEKLRHKAEARVHVSGADLFAHAEHEDMYAAIDAMVDKLDRQLIKHKEKVQSHK